jgi:hypothetical protein
MKGFNRATHAQMTPPLSSTVEKMHALATLYVESGLLIMLYTYMIRTVEMTMTLASQLAEG